MNCSEVKVTISIPENSMKDILITAFESGCYGSFAIDDYDYNGHLKPDDEYPYAWLPLQEGSAVICFDKYEFEENGDQDLEYFRLDFHAIERGLDILSKKYPHIFCSIIQENYDVIDADALIQCCLLGDVIYG